MDGFTGAVLGFLQIETGFPVTAFSGTRFKRSRYRYADNADNALSTNLIPARGLKGCHFNRHPWTFPKLNPRKIVCVNGHLQRLSCGDNGSLRKLPVAGLSNLYTGDIPSGGRKCSRGWQQSHFLNDDRTSSFSPLAGIKFVESLLLLNCQNFDNSSFS